MINDVKSIVNKSNRHKSQQTVTEAIDKGLKSLACSVKYLHREACPPTFYTGVGVAASTASNVYEVCEVRANTSIHVDELRHSATSTRTRKLHQLSHKDKGSKSLACSVHTYSPPVIGHTVSRTAAFCYLHPLL